MSITTKDLEDVMDMLDIEPNTGEPHEGWQPLILDVGKENLKHMADYQISKGAVWTEIEYMESFDQDDPKDEYMAKSGYLENCNRIKNAIEWVWENPHNAILCIDTVSIILFMRVEYMKGLIPEMFLETNGCYVILDLLALWNWETKTLGLKPEYLFDIPGAFLTAPVIQVLNATRDPNGSDGYEELIKTQNMRPEDFDATDEDNDTHVFFDNEHDWEYTTASLFANKAFSISMLDQVEGPSVFKLRMKGLNTILNWVSRSKDLTSSVLDYATNMKV